MKNHKIWKLYDLEYHLDLDMSFGQKVLRDKVLNGNVRTILRTLGVLDLNHIRWA